MPADPPQHSLPGRKRITCNTCSYYIMVAMDFTTAWDTSFWNATKRRTTSINWPLEVDERLRLLVNLVGAQLRDQVAAQGGLMPTRPPSAAMVLSNILMQLPLEDVAYLGIPPTQQQIDQTKELNEKFDWPAREPWLGRARYRAFVEPRRIHQRAGHKLPEATIFVGHPSPFENPWKARNSGGQWRVHGPNIKPTNCPDKASAYSQAAALYGQWLAGDRRLRGPELDERHDNIIDGIRNLRGFHLACQCPLDMACIADLLLRLANPEEIPRPVEGAKDTEFEGD